MENRTVVAVDLAKSVFEIAVSHTPGEVSRTERLPRSKFLAFFETMPPCIVVMEACGSAHHWGRKLQALGHVVVLLPPHLVRPYITGNKTDRTDAKGMPQGQAARSSRRTATKASVTPRLGYCPRPKMATRSSAELCIMK